MRTITPDSFEVYTFDELDEQAQQRALDEVGGRLAGPWWDASDEEDVANAIVLGLADKLGTPGAANYGSADFPGIPGVTLEGYDMGRAQAVQFVGELTRQNAPALPWPEDVYRVRLGPLGTTDTEVVVATEDVEGDLPGVAVQVHDAVVAALQAAFEAGVAEWDHKHSEQYAREHIEANELEFTADGEPYVR